MPLHDTCTAWLLPACTALMHRRVQVTLTVQQATPTSSSRRRAVFSCGRMTFSVGTAGSLSCLVFAPGLLGSETSFRNSLHASPCSHHEWTS